MCSDFFQAYRDCKEQWVCVEVLGGLLEEESC